MEDVQMNFESELEEDHEEESEGEYDLEGEDQDSSDENPQIIKYNPNDFKLLDIIKKLQNLNILKNNFICSVCHCNMTYYPNKNYMDRYIWRCIKTNANNHDIKVNIRKYSFIENIRADLRMIYFIIFYNKAFTNAKEFAKDINIPTISRKNISKIYNTN